MSEGIPSNLRVIQERVAQAAARVGRNASACELLVVSKTWPADKVIEVVDAGQISFGENKVQEAEGKIPVLPSHLQWHLIGHLQRNKVRKALPLFGTLHGVDSLKLARYTSNLAGELNVKPNVYLQVDLADESSKNGFDPDVLSRDLDGLLALNGIHIIGLMCIPPAVASAEDARPWFVKLRQLRDALESQSGYALPGLSMGMSGDFEVAIEEGSTIVRVGSAIFGSRNYL